MLRVFLVASLLQIICADQAQRSLQDGGSAFMKIAGYQPSTLVTDHNALDLDQAAIEDQLSSLSEETFGNAVKVYEQGGHSKSFATLQLSQPLTEDLPPGTHVRGRADDQDTVVKGKTKGVHQVNSDVLQVLYQVLEEQDSYVDCQVGGMAGFGEANRDGCFADSGTIMVDNRTDLSFDYTYNPRADNNNGRTIAVFSKDAGNRMRPSATAPYYSTFQKYVNYYGQPDYGDMFIVAAASPNGKATEFVSTRGNADFSSDLLQHPMAARKEGFRRGTVLLNIWMYVIRELEDAIDDCHRGDRDAHALNEAVAFWTGSLEGEDGSGTGVLMHGIADEFCAKMGTCDGDGNSMVNKEMFSLFEEGRDMLLLGLCKDTRRVKEKIENLMVVPLVQGMLWYANQEDPTSGNKANGAAFAAAVLPHVHHCNPMAADVVYEQMKVGYDTASPDFKAVKSAVEGSYGCMNIKCSQVGGVVNGNGDTKACSDGKNRKVAVIVPIFVGLGVVVVLGGMYVRRRATRKEPVVIDSSDGEFVGAESGQAVI